ncbi:MAG: outer membrane beta-barrel family protein, partial [Saprospiraceae bacterium]
TLLDQATKQPINGAIADEKGRFSILQVAAGKYTLRLSFLGFDQKELQNVGLGEGQNLNLGTFRLLPSGAALQEVTVTGQKALIEEKVDRLVYNAENDLTSRGGSAADLLQKVPLLSVDLDGNVSLRGSQSITVLINGKPSAIMAGNVADALKQLPANLIKSVEVITSPSAKYDAEGAAGIINIILKKSTLEGFTMNVNGDVGNRGAKLGLNGSYRQGKLGISLGGNGRTNYNRAATTLEQTTLADGITFRTDQTAAANDRPLFGNYTLGIDYDLDSNQSLTAGARFGARNFRRMQRLETDLYENDVLSSSSVRDVNGRDLSPSVDVNLDYLHTFQPRQEWSMATQYSRNKLTNNYDTDFLGEDEAVTSRLKNVNSNLNQEFTLQSDYQTPVTKNQLLEFGAKGIFRRVNSAYQYLFAENAGAVFLPDASRPSGLLDYNQNIGATYVSHTLAAAKKLTFKTGLRYEYTSISAATEESAFSIPAYGVLVPSINLAKTTAAGATFKLGYNRRIQRPGLQQLNPNFNTANPQNVSIGNPNLNPELTDNLEIGLSTHIKQTYLNLSLFGRSTDNAISQVRFASDTLTGALVTTYQNIGKQRMAGANFFGNLYLTANWTLNGSMEVAYSYLQGTAIGLDGTSVTTSNTGFNVNGRLMSQYRFQHGWAVEAFGFMRGAQVQLQGRQGGFGMYKVGVKKDFNNKKGSIGLAAENFLTTGVNIMRTELEAPTFSQISSTHLFNRGFELTFEYNIGKVTATPRKKLRSVKNDDVKEGEN